MHNGILVCSHTLTWFIQTPTAIARTDPVARFPTIPSPAPTYRCRLYASTFCLHSSSGLVETSARCPRSLQPPAFDLPCRASDAGQCVGECAVMSTNARLEDVDGSLSRSTKVGEVVTYLAYPMGQRIPQLRELRPHRTSRVRIRLIAV